MNYHFTFGSPIKDGDDISQPTFLPQTTKKDDNKHGSLSEQETHNNSKARKKFMKIYSGSMPDPSYKKIPISQEQHHAVLNSTPRKNSSKLCRCFEGGKKEEVVDFGFTSGCREVSPDPKRKKVGKIETPVNELIQLEKQGNQQWTHQLRPSRR